MKQKIIYAGLAMFMVLVLGGCGNQDDASRGNLSAEKNENGKNANINESEKIQTGDIKDEAVGYPKVCQKESVNLPNYGDPGKRLASCFVEYPGEPSRQDKSYYIVEDICGQFTKEFIENMLVQKLFKIELPKISTINDCTYYFDEKEYIMLNLEYLSVENQKKGNEAMDRKVEKSSKIPMDNLVVLQEGDLINVIYLILGPEKFISIRPSSLAATKITDFTDFAANIAKEIKNYK